MKHKRAWHSHTALATTLVSLAAGIALHPQDAAALDRRARLPSVEINLDVLEELRQSRYRRPAAQAPIARRRIPQANPVHAMPSAPVDIAPFKTAAPEPYVAPQSPAVKKEVQKPMPAPVPVPVKKAPKPAPPVTLANKPAEVARKADVVIPSPVPTLPPAPPPAPPIPLLETETTDIKADIDLPPMEDLDFPDLPPPTPDDTIPEAVDRAEDVKVDVQATDVTEHAALPDGMDDMDSMADMQDSPLLAPISGTTGDTPESAAEALDLPPLHDIEILEPDSEEAFPMAETDAALDVAPTMDELEIEPPIMDSAGEVPPPLLTIPETTETTREFPATGIDATPEKEASFFSRMANKVTGYFSDEEEANQDRMTEDVGLPVVDAPDTMANDVDTSIDIPALPSELPPLDDFSVPTVAVIGEDNDTVEIPVLDEPVGLPPVAALLKEPSLEKEEISTDLAFLQDDGSKSNLEKLAPMPEVSAETEPDVPEDTAKPDVRITFQGAETTVPPSQAPALQKLAQTLKNNTEKRVTIVAYAGKKGRQTSVARRVSLSRALSIRSYLIEQGVDNLRINVKAMGGKFDSGPSDRADIMLEE